MPVTMRRGRTNHRRQEHRCPTDAQQTTSVGHRCCSIACDGPQPDQVEPSGCELSAVVRRVSSKIGQLPNAAPWPLERVWRQRASHGPGLVEEAVHPYISQALAAERVKDQHRKATRALAASTARIQGRSKVRRRAATNPVVAPQPVATAEPCTRQQPALAPPPGTAPQPALVPPPGTAPQPALVPCGPVRGEQASPQADRCVRAA
jgi:hypothetical protein